MRCYVLKFLFKLYLMNENFNLNTILVLSNINNARGNIYKLKCAIINGMIKYKFFDAIIIAGNVIEKQDNDSKMNEAISESDLEDIIKSFYEISDMVIFIPGPNDPIYQFNSKSNTKQTNNLNLKSKLQIFYDKNYIEIGKIAFHGIGGSFKEVQEAAFDHKVYKTGQPQTNDFDEKSSFNTLVDSYQSSQHKENNIIVSYTGLKSNQLSLSNISVKSVEQISDSGSAYFNTFIEDLDDNCIPKPILIVHSQNEKNQGLSEFKDITVVNPGKFSLGKFAIVNLKCTDKVFSVFNTEFYDLFKIF